MDAMPSLLDEVMLRLAGGCRDPMYRNISSALAGSLASVSAAASPDSLAASLSALFDSDSGLRLSSTDQTLTCPSAHPVTSLHFALLSPSSPPSRPPPGGLKIEQSKHPTLPRWPVRVCTQHCPFRSQTLTNPSDPDVTNPSTPPLCALVSAASKEGRTNAMPDTGPRCPNSLNSPVSAMTSHRITTPSAPPLANRPTLPPTSSSNLTIWTGEDPCPFSTRGSLHANSSLSPRKLPVRLSSECASPFRSASSTPAEDAKRAISLGSSEKTRTDPSVQPVATLTSPLPSYSSSSPDDPPPFTSRHTIWLEFKARPVPTPPLSISL
mmetsp:Transcript_30521/g.73672  ORF Transcript_30521/g.73672 Transcript_30521/m.73672 type:complete len:324 (+) Transcript_30521:250-1221(+)